MAPTESPPRPSSRPMTIGFLAVLAIFRLSRVTFRASAETNQLNGQQPANRDHRIIWGKDEHQPTQRILDCTRRCCLGSIAYKLRQRERNGKSFAVCRSGLFIPGGNDCHHAGGVNRKRPADSGCNGSHPDSPRTGTVGGACFQPALHVPRWPSVLLLPRRLVSENCGAAICRGTRVRGETRGCGHLGRRRQ
jgi:hypothetical protein